jgi:hypothetical protein
MEEVQKLLAVPANPQIYVMEKARPTIDNEKHRSKSGIHIVIPEICTTSLIQQSIRRSLVPRMPEFFGGLPLTNDWESV